MSLAVEGWRRSSVAGRFAVWMEWAATHARHSAIIFRIASNSESASRSLILIGWRKYCVSMFELRANLLDEAALLTERRWFVKVMPTLEAHCSPTLTTAAPATMISTALSAVERGIPP